MATQATETAQGGSPIPVVSVSSPSSLLSAAHDTGFLYLALPTAEPKPRKVGPTEQQVADMFKLSAKFFTSDSDKSKFIVPGSYFGFHSEEKKTGYEPWDSIGLNKKGSYDFKATMNFPVHGMPDFSGWYADKTGSIPDIFKENWKQVNDFCKACHELAEETLRSLADALGLPDRDYLVKRHLASEPSGTYLRLLYYPPFESTTSEMEELGLGSLTFLFQDNVGGLEVQKGYSMPATWTPVPAQPGKVVVNVADMMQFWSGGYLKSTFHRVVSPPTSRGLNPPRFSIAYFLHPNDEIVLSPLPSPLLSQSSGAGVVYKQGQNAEWTPTSKEWRVHRHGQTQGVKGDKDGMEGKGKL